MTSFGYSIQIVPDNCRTSCRNVEFRFFESQGFVYIFQSKRLTEKKAIAYSVNIYYKNRKKTMDFVLFQCLLSELIHKILLLPIYIPYKILF